MFLRANTEKEMGFTLAQLRQPGNLGFHGPNLAGLEKKLIWGLMQCLDWPFISSKFVK
jgi:hypothetical protein